MHEIVAKGVGGVNVARPQLEDELENLGCTKHGCVECWGASVLVGPADIDLLPFEEPVDHLPQPL
jgi:hypothetical protein